jgi:hypothetical protein
MDKKYESPCTKGLISDSHQSATYTLINTKEVCISSASNTMSNLTYYMIG